MCCIGRFLASIAWLTVGFFLLLILFAFIVVFTYRLLFTKKRKHSSGYQQQWYGREAASATEKDDAVRPFKIEVSEDVLQDLHRRLEATRFEDPVEDSRFLYGFNSNILKKVVEYWRKEYDWRKQERMLNQFPQYKTRIEGIDVHFLHVKPDLPQDSKLKVLPLMIIHGWPGSVVEFYKLIPLLTTPRPDRDFVFEVVCPSIPGYGFSESPHQKGFNARAAARIFITLMERIGHPKFYVQGGDWGSAIANIMARYYAPRILGLHLNLYMNQLRWWEQVKLFAIALCPFLVSKQEYRTCLPLSRILKMFWEEMAYMHMQATKPDTIGCAMSDSPAGMAAYLLEKFPSWTDPETRTREDGGLTDKFTMDELLTNVMLYWCNNNFTAAARFYKENMGDMWNRRYEGLDITVPTALAVFPNELLAVPRTCTTQQIKKLVSYNVMPRGGHFAAFEEPELLADDVWQFVTRVHK